MLCLIIMYKYVVTGKYECGGGGSVWMNSAVSINNAFFEDYEKKDEIFIIKTHQITT